MKARIITSVAAAGTLAIVACNQDLAKSPLIPTQASFTAFRALTRARTRPCAPAPRRTSPTCVR